MQIPFLVIAVAVIAAVALSQATAFKLPFSFRSQLPESTLSIFSSLNYGRGAEIWPECNESPVQLKDSFPNGIIPESAGEALMTPINTNDPTSRNPFQKILSRLEGDSTFDVTPTVISAALLVRGLVSPMDIIVVTAITGYWTILLRLSQSTRLDGKTPTLPALPPHGHVPTLVSNPLGNPFTNSEMYDQWLKTSVVLSLVLPIGLIMNQLTRKQFPAARLFARPLFYLCCQAISESVARKAMAPLPIRILIPIMYNAVRLIPLWVCTSSSIMGRLTRVIAAANLGYWALNLFVFLLPIAAIRYLRAHFYGVEAEEVKVREGFDVSVGLLS